MTIIRKMLSHFLCKNFDDSEYKVCFNIREILNHILKSIIYLWVLRDYL